MYTHKRDMNLNIKPFREKGREGVGPTTTFQFPSALSHHSCTENGLAREGETLLPSPSLFTQLLSSLILRLSV